MKKEEALQIMYKSAILYKNNLENRNILFVYGPPQHPAYLETVFYERKTVLMTDRLVGNINACIGFVPKDEKSNYFVPNTALKADIRELVDKPQRVLAVFSKDIHEEKYNKLCYVAKKLTLEDIKFSAEITNKLL